MAQRWWRAIIVALVAAQVGCISTKSCTERGCQDQLDIEIKRADGSVPAGQHVIEVTADSVTTTCTLDVAGSTAIGSCPSALSVHVGQEQDCVEMKTGSAVSLKCTPIPGRFFEAVTLSGKPAQVRVRITVDGAVVLDRSLQPTYVATQPNGPGCEPTCHQASIAWTFDT
jgi:hypothetical protein